MVTASAPASKANRIPAELLESALAMETRLYPQHAKRYARAAQMLASGVYLEPLRGGYWLVGSQCRADTAYTVSLGSCTCLDAQQRGLPCKHVAVLRLHSTIHTVLQGRCCPVVRPLPADELSGLLERLSAPPSYEARQWRQVVDGVSVAAQQPTSQAAIDELFGEVA